MAQSNEPVVNFAAVNMQYGDAWALRDITFDLRPGDTRIIFGEAGSGKTTLLKAAIGLVQPDDGKIKLFGLDVVGCSDEELFPIRARAGVLFQESGLFDSLTVRENVAYPLANSRKGPIPDNAEIERRVRESLRFVELEHTIEQFPSSLSGGMRRRVGIARAIVTEPPFVLYDSPTAGLDPITANTIMAVIAKERDTRQTAALIVTHRYQDGELMANFRYNKEKEELVAVDESEHHDPARSRTKFFVMKEGTIVFTGTRTQMESSTDGYVQRFVRR